MGRGWATSPEQNGSGPRQPPRSADWNPRSYPRPPLVDVFFLKKIIRGTMWAPKNWKTLTCNDICINEDSSSSPLKIESPCIKFVKEKKVMRAMKQKRKDGFWNPLSGGRVQAHRKWRTWLLDKLIFLHLSSTCQKPNLHQTKVIAKHLWRRLLWTF